jgi:hypothetical protein
MAVKKWEQVQMALHLYPKEGNPLWEEYSTRIKVIYFKKVILVIRLIIHIQSHFNKCS